MRALIYAQGMPWAMPAEVLENLLEIASREKLSQEETISKLEALAAKIGKPLQNTRESYVRDGVGVVPVIGPIFRYANLFTDLSGATSLDALAQDFTAAMDNPGVRHVVLEINSPGGQADGTNEFAKMIAAARDVKPVIAYVGGLAQSGGYWIASAASQIVVDETALLGSIGVVMSGRVLPERDGVKKFEIVSSQSPFKRVDPTTDAGRAKVQETVDALAQVFIETVARNRGVEPAKVLSDFGAGHSLVGADAVKAGMADRVGSLEGLISELGSRSSTYSFGGTAANARRDMEDKSRPGAAEPNPAQAQNADAIRAEGHAAGAKDGRVAERARIAAILTDAEAKDREQLARTLAFESDMEPAAAAKILAAAPKAVAATANPLAAAMGQIPNPSVGPDASGGGEETAQALGARLAAIANGGK